MGKLFNLKWEISKLEAGRTIKEFLREKQISKASLTDIKFNGGKILLNSVETNVRYCLSAGDILDIYFPLEVPSIGMKSEAIKLDIVYEDDYILVVNKPAFMNTIPSREHPSGSLANALLGYFQTIELISATHIVTRLDRDTSGLVLVAKHRHVHHLLSEQQKKGTVNRTYIALVHGNMERNSGTVVAPIGRKPDSIIEREVSMNGQFASTHYRVVARYSSFDVVELQLETGRTHQIRVHMSYLGHPLLGDDLYGGPIEWINRQALHCKFLSFVHPFQNKLISFEIPLADDIEKIIKAVQT